MSQILIADDDPGIVRLLKLLVERQGFLVDIARDGREAIEKIEKGSYVLMLLDLQMPRFNGFDVVEYIAQLPKRPVLRECQPTLTYRNSSIGSTRTVPASGLFHRSAKSWRARILEWERRRNEPRSFGK